jgi:hypothetical protein
LNDVSNEAIATALSEFFPSRSQDIYNEYNSETNTAKNITQREEIKTELLTLLVKMTPKQNRPSWLDKRIYGID